jgi:hypothetical protein
MKKNIIKGSLIALLSLGMIGVAQADILVTSSTFKNEDLCQQIEGLWAGKGVVSWGLSCTYKGTVNITKKYSDEFNMQVDLHKESGSFFCPEKESLPLEGSCKNGTIVIKTSMADLNGGLSDGGRKANVKGTIKYGALNLKADIDLTK